MEENDEDAHPFPNIGQVSQNAYLMIEHGLTRPNPERVRRASLRLSPAGDVVDRETFCEIPEGYSIQEVSLALSQPAGHHVTVVCLAVAGSL